jgi:hypothetical protein
MDVDPHPPLAGGINASNHNVYVQTIVLIAADFKEKMACLTKNSKVPNFQSFS